MHRVLDPIGFLSAVRLLAPHDAAQRPPASRSISSESAPFQLANTHASQQRVYPIASQRFFICDPRVAACIEVAACFADDARSGSPATNCSTTAFPKGGPRAESIKRGRMRARWRGQRGHVARLNRAAFHADSSPAIEKLQDQRNILFFPK